MTRARPNVSAESPSGGEPSWDELIGARVRGAPRDRAPPARGPRRPGTLSTTALVHEAYLKLADHPHVEWRDRSHFFAVASLAMRHVLVDRAKARATLKRGGVRHRITLDEAEIAVDDQADALLQLDDALDRLAEVEPRLAKVVECRFFGGLTEEEIAERSASRSARSGAIG